MRLNKAEIEQGLEVLNMRLGLGTYADKFPAYVLLEKLAASNYTMAPMSENELYVLFKESYSYAPKNILHIYEDFISTLPTDIEISLTDKEDELWFEVEGELISITI